MDPASMVALLVMLGIVGLVVGRSGPPAGVGPALDRHLGWAGLSITAALIGAGLGATRMRAGLVLAAIAVLGELSTGVPPRHPLATLIVVAAGSWTVGMVAGFHLVRDARIAPTIVVLGTALMVAEVPGGADGWTAMAAPAGFAMASLVAIVRLELAERRRGWVSRRIVTAPGVGRIWVGGGVALASLSVGIATLLAVVVLLPPMAAPLMPGPGGPGGAGTLGAYRDRARIAESWVTSESPVLRVRSGDGVGRALVEHTFAWFDGHEWTHGLGGTDARTVAAGADGLVGTIDGLGSAASSASTTVAITNLAAARSAVVAPAVTLRVERDLVAHGTSDGGVVFGAAFREPVQAGDTYKVTIATPRDRDDPASAAHLAAAGSAYPSAIERFRTVAPGSLSVAARDRARTFRDGHPAMDPYHVATRMEAWFAGTDPSRPAEPGFSYAADIHGRCPSEQGVVDCLLTIRAGFCQHYATAMALMLQSLGIPARYVEGFLPGRQEADGSWLVPASAAHAWVEVFFPGSGWVPFDPTPGGDGSLRSGGLAASAGATGSASPEAAAAAVTEPSPSQRAGAGTTDPTGADDGTLPDPGGSMEALAALAMVMVLSVVLAAGVWRVRARRVRAPGRDPALLFRAIATQASSRGYGRRPGQTDHEYASMLGRIAPTVAADLRRLADAKVEAAYGLRPPGPATLDGLVVGYERTIRALRVTGIRLQR